jgi:hypothetical protein
MNTTVQASLDSLLDMQLDDIADLPEFKSFPAGAHKVSISLESKQVGTHPCVEVKLVAIETLELASPTDTVPLSAGDSTGVLYMLDNEFGVGKLKAVLKPLSVHCGTTGIRDTIEASKNLEAVVLTKIRRNRISGVEYTDLISIAVL